MKPTSEQNFDSVSITPTDILFRKLLFIIETILFLMFLLLFFNS